MFMRCKSVSMGMNAPTSLLILPPNFKKPSVYLFLCRAEKPLLTMSGDVRGEPHRNLSLSLPTVREVPQSAWLKLHHLSFARLGICSSCPSQLPILISFYSLFTTDSADNKQRQPRSSENTLWSYLLMADHPIVIGKSEVDNWTKDEEAALLSTGLVISSPVPSSPPNPNCQASRL